MLCLVCGADGSEPHYGGSCCRACAAFFRRYVHSTKQEISCTCDQRLISSHPCRYCRMLKCMKIGMCKTQVQPPREKNKILNTFPGTTIMISKLSNSIIPKSCNNMYRAVAKWVDFDQRRKELRGDDYFDYNLTQITKMVNFNTNLLWKLGESIFSDVSRLSKEDKNSMISNFYIKWQLLMEPAIDYSAQYEQFKNYIGSNAYYQKCAYFYGSSMQKGNKISDVETVKVFSPFWDYYYADFAEPVYKMNYDKVEYMAIFLLLLFDGAYSDISDDGVNLCTNIRKVILRELNSYQSNNNCSEVRLADIMETLRLLDKHEEKLHYQFWMCGSHKMIMDENYVQIYLGIKH